MMPMLGDLLASARLSADGIEGWLADARPDLAARLAEEAAAEGVSPAAFLRLSVADFECYASGEDWATLTSRLRDSEAPGAACLVAMLEWRLAGRAVPARTPPEGHAR